MAAARGAPYLPRMNPPLLFRRYPGLAARTPWLPLAQLPTPVEPVLIEHEGRTLPVLVKRDDLSAQPYGGNKVRKLEFLLGEVVAKRAGRVITAGAFGSHHALATTIYARQQGLAVTCVLFPQHLTPHVRDILGMIAAHGAELRFTRRLEGVPFALQRARWAHRAERPCIIPPGGSSLTGTLGYINAALELDAQIRAGACPEPTVIHVAAGTLGTAAGIALGLALAGRRIPVQATRITSSLVANPRTLRRLVGGAATRLAAAGAKPPAAAAVLAMVELRDDQIGAGYGRETAAGRAAAEAFARAGLVLDPTYTAKAAAALLAERGERPLFWHTLSAAEPLDSARQLDLEALPAPFARALAPA